METEVRKEIFRLAQTVTGLSASNTFYLEARQGATYPYCVFSEITNPFKRDTKTDFETVYFQFSLYGTDLTALETLDAAVIDVFDNSESSFSLTNFNVRGIIREYRKNAAESFRVWHTVVRYRLELERV